MSVVLGGFSVCVEHNSVCSDTLQVKRGPAAQHRMHLLAHGSALGMAQTAYGDSDRSRKLLVLGMT